MESVVDILSCVILAYFTIGFLIWLIGQRIDPLNSRDFYDNKINHYRELLFLTFVIIAWGPLFIKYLIIKFRRES